MLNGKRCVPDARVHSSSDGAEERERARVVLVAERRKCKKTRALIREIQVLPDSMERKQRTSSIASRPATKAEKRKKEKKRR